ncbi:hypothetical protein B296_00046308 [Ensete ventricosum]|uniref:Uncharacterized protein n=1 Tax=Ensete ventricosum TaxID=4639 RepID=A0A426XH66_ENSVE|nr:hypothetical protein B296_00046308 [Ensete ventricosum]
MYDNLGKVLRVRSRGVKEGGDGVGLRADAAACGAVAVRLTSVSSTVDPGVKRGSLRSGPTAGLELQRIGDAFRDVKLQGNPRRGSHTCWCKYGAWIVR